MWCRSTAVSTKGPPRGRRERGLGEVEILPSITHPWRRLAGDQFGRQATKQVARRVGSDAGAWASSAPRARSVSWSDPGLSSHGALDEGARHVRVALGHLAFLVGGAEGEIGLEFRDHRGGSPGPGPPSGRGPARHRAATPSASGAAGPLVGSPLTRRPLESVSPPPDGPAKPTLSFGPPICGRARSGCRPQRRRLRPCSGPWTRRRTAACS